MKGRSMKEIAIDDDVWRELQRRATLPSDSPNATLRRLLKLDQTTLPTLAHVFAIGTEQWSKREPKQHRLESTRHRIGNQDIWWFGIPPLGKKYQCKDVVVFNLNDFRGSRPGQISLELSGRTLERLNHAPKDKKGYTHVKISRQCGANETKIYFGRKDYQDNSEAVTVQLVDGDEA
jgi:hypothetical protein